MTIKPLKSLMLLLLLSFSLSTEAVIRLDKIGVHYLVAAADTNGLNPRASIQQLEAGVEQLNENFKEAGFEFEYAGVTYITNDMVNGFYNDEWLTEYEEDLRPYLVNGKFNIAVADLKGKNGHAYWYWEATDSVQVEPEDLDTSTIAHELGHNFGLLHTFQNNDDGPISLLEGPEGWRYGDKLIDTPVDPGEFSDFNNCVFVSNKTDQDGNVYTPDGYNIMGKGNNRCRYRFSEQQIRKMKRIMATDKFHLTNSYGESQNPSCLNSTIVTDFPHLDGFNYNYDITKPIWVQDSFNDDLNWKYSNKTLTPATGANLPIDGHSFFHVEASYEYLFAAEELNLLSPCYFSESTYIEASFYYSMYGDDIGELSLLITTDAGDSWQSIWSKQGAQHLDGDTWSQAVVDLSQYQGQNFQLMLKAQVLGGDYGDISVDQMVINNSDVALDYEADPITIASYDNAPVNQLVTSDSFTVSGINTDIELRITNGEYAINCEAGNFTNTATTVSNNTQLCVRHNSSTAYSSSVTTTIYIGEQQVSFVSTTSEQPTPTEPPMDLNPPKSSGSVSFVMYLFMCLAVVFRRIKLLVNIKTLLIVLLPISAVANAKSPLTINDIMHFNKAKSVEVSANGGHLALISKPFRGDGVGKIYNLKNSQLVKSVANAEDVDLVAEDRFAAFTIKPSLFTKTTADKKQLKKLTDSLVLVELTTNKQFQFENVSDFKVSDNGKFLAYRSKNESKKASKNKDASVSADDGDSYQTLTLVNLSTDTKQQIHHVGQYQFDNDSGQLVYHQFDGQMQGQVALLSLSSQQVAVLKKAEGLHVAAMSWHPKAAQLAFTTGNYQDSDDYRRVYQLNLWQDGKITNINPHKDNWFVGKKSQLKWDKKGSKLFFQSRPNRAAKVENKEVTNEQDLYDHDIILQQAKLTMWHPNDRHIKPREKVMWNREYKHKQFWSVYHLNIKKVINLSSPTYPYIRLNTNTKAQLVGDNRRYNKLENYQGGYADYYAVDSDSGATTLIQQQAPFRPSLSPSGKYAAYFLKGQLYLRNLNNLTTQVVDMPNNELFSDDQHDYPREDPGFGIAGWTKNEQTFLVYDKFDIWAVNPKTLKKSRLTKGKESNTRYRLVKTNSKQVTWNLDKTQLLQTTNLTKKNSGFTATNFNSGSEKSMMGEYKLRFITKSKKADTLLFSKENYQTFADLWQTNQQLNEVKKVTNLNPQMADLLWGQQPELISYKGYNGEDLQGTLIKPAGYKKGDKVPVVIYFYRYMTPRHYDFPRMDVNHRPNLPLFTSNGYAVFMPDIRFEIGHPGKSSTQTMINAAQKLIDLGIADPDNIGLQGHSWAGYQSAFMITQTDMFKAIITGAPVSNMTSAYGGIRLKSGKTRQFQYETGQSRLGKSLFEDRDLYIENSPIFFADKINTPTLIMFGDKDDAVPWHEGVQLYLAMLRAEKDVIFLQYHDEPHHLKQIGNQLDYTIRMFEYFEHHLKGKPAAKWMKEGIPYQKED